MSKKCSLCTIRILLSLGSHHVDFQNRPLSKSISRLHYELQIHNKIEFTTLVYRCDHKVTHCTDSVVKSNSTLLIPMISLYEAFWSDYDIDQVSPSKEVHGRNNNLQMRYIPQCDYSIYMQL